MRLCDELKKYGDSDFYPFHMPGHKRNPKFLEDLYDGKGNLVDITEIYGFDNLHNAQGILEEEQNRAAKIFGAERSFILVNGSSCGIISAIASVVPYGGNVLVARNCHKSVFNGLRLRETNNIYITPEEKTYSGYGIKLTGAVSASEIETELERKQDIKLVIITSPTYEGICSDIRSISDVCHKKGVPLMVDAAHGAHFGLHSEFPESAVAQGADIVINSLHKTLPALTSTALLHVCGNLVDITSIKYYLQVFQTSSPSYLLMSSVSSCLKYLESKESKKDFDIYVNQLKNLYQESKHILSAENRDISKVVIIPPNGISGVEYADFFRKNHHLEMEMSTSSYVLAMTSVCDTPEGFHRLKRALDSEFVPEDQRLTADKTTQGLPDQKWVGKEMPIALVPYPPGIPLVQKGEILTKEHLDSIKKLLDEGIQIEGLKDIR